MERSAFAASRRARDRPLLISPRSWTIDSDTFSAGRKACRSRMRLTPQTVTADNEESAFGDART